jgi:cytochrome oxidase Cu insertion factor (SCO1/SenC/PrrC family)
MNSKQILAPLIASVLMLAGCTGIESEASKFYGEDITPKVLVEDFTLVNGDGEDWNFNNKTEDKIVIIAFLFTNCIDICPIVTENLRWVHSQLSPEEHNQTQFLTANSTEENAPQFQTIQSVWNNFAVGLSIEEQELEETGNNSTSARHHPDAYSVNHSTGTVIVDSKGMQRIWWGDNDWITDLFLADVRTLLAEIE